MKPLTLVPLLFSVFLCCCLRGYSFPASVNEILAHNGSDPMFSVTETAPMPHRGEQHNWTAHQTQRTSSMHTSEMWHKKPSYTYGADTYISIAWPDVSSNSYSFTTPATAHLPTPSTLHHSPQKMSASHVPRSWTPICPSSMPHRAGTSKTTYLPQPTFPPNYTTTRISSSLTTIKNTPTTSTTLPNYPCSTSTPIYRMTLNAPEPTCSGTQTLSPRSCPTMIPIDNACNVMWFSNITGICTWVDDNAKWQAGVGPEDILRINQMYCQNVSVST